MRLSNVVDSSGWLEYFSGSSRADIFAPAIEDTDNLIVPVISIYEVFKKVLREHGETGALRIASAMTSGRVVDLDTALALSAAPNAPTGRQHHLRHGHGAQRNPVDPGRTLQKSSSGTVLFQTLGTLI